MPNPIKICRKCGEEFRLKPEKPGFADVCLECSVPKPKKLTKDERQKVDLARITELGKENSQTAVIEAITDFIMKYGKRED
jgi:hypothetical protein